MGNARNSKCVGAKEKRDFIKFLKEHGYEYDHNSGSHEIYKNYLTGDTKVLTRRMNKLVMQRIRKEVLNYGKDAVVL